MQTKLDRQQSHQSYLRKPIPEKTGTFLTLLNLQPSMSDARMFSTLSQESKGR